jgi:hypothetical protein
MKLMKSFRFILGFALVVVFGWWALFTQADEARQLHRVCEADAQKYCVGLAKGPCLVKNISRISPECAALTAVRYSQRQKIQKTCAADIEKYCPSQAVGEGALGLCLHEEKSRLSQACQKEFGLNEDKVKSAVEICKTDIPKFCAAIRNDDRLIGACLEKKDPDLSDDCRNALPAIL